MSPSCFYLYPLLSGIACLVAIAIVLRAPSSSRSAPRRTARDDARRASAAQPGSKHPTCSNSLGTVWSLPSLVLDFCCLTPEHEDLDFAVQSAVQVQIQVLMAWASRRVYEFNRQPRLAHFEICLRHLPRGTSLARRYLSGPSLPRPIDQRRSRDPPADVPGRLRHHTRGHHFSAALPASQAAGAQNA